MKAGRELDAHVEREVMGRPVIYGVRVMWECGSTFPDFGIDDGSETPALGNHDALYTPVPLRSTDIAAAWEVVEKMRERGFDMELRTFTEGVVAEFREYEKPTNEEADGRAAVDPRDGGAPLAICLAAFRACGAEVPS